MRGLEAQAANFSARVLEHARLQVELDIAVAAIREVESRRRAQAEALAVQTLKAPTARAPTGEPALAVGSNAVPPDTPIAPRPMRSATLSGSLGFLLCIVAAFVLEHLRVQRGRLAVA